MVWRIQVWQEGFKTICIICGESFDEDTEPVLVNVLEFFQPVTAVGTSGVNGETTIKAQKCCQECFSDIMINVGKASAEAVKAREGARRKQHAH